jgi:hypothetical protein
MLRPDLITLDAYIMDAMQLGRAPFLAKHPWPMLVVSEPDWDRIRRTGRLDTVVPGTSVPGIHELVDAQTALAKGATLDALCLPVRPTDPARSDAITIGRSVEADVVLLDETVSNLHAKASWDQERDRCLLADQASRNGTYLDGERLAPKSPRELWAGAMLSFGFLLTRYYSPRAFFEWLSSGTARSSVVARKRSARA